MKTADSVVVVKKKINPVLSLNNGCGRNYLILLEIVLTPNLHLTRNSINS